ncbi:MAG: hypothetical protein M5U34_08200 [Chloroflexi bacterium]|nr:hypothetical protein [Chloroflexota bacterium]
MNSEQWTVDSGQWTVDSGRLAVSGKRRVVDRYHPFSFCSHSHTGN